jgi:hypothetical protein
LKQTRTIDEIYALIDKDRGAAAEAARLKFRGDIDSAIAAVSEISAVAGTRIVADSQVASAKILIDAEVSATRLLSEAELRAARCVHESLSKPHQVVEAMLLEISRSTSEHLSTAANDSIAAIKRDAETAIASLKVAGANAIQEMQELASRVENQLNIDAGVAAEKLRKFRERPHSAEEAETEADRACRLVIRAASEGTSSLRVALNGSLETVNKITDEACAAVQDAAQAAEKRLSQGQAQALRRLDELISMSLGPRKPASKSSAGCVSD